MDDMVAMLTTRLEEFGVHVDVRPRPQGVDDVSDVDLVLSRGDTQQTFALELKGHATRSDLIHNRRSGTESLPLLVGAASVSPRSADAFRRSGVQYIDVAGNASIHFGDLFIDVRGRRSEGAAFERTRGRGGNLFSPARAQIVFALLQWSRLWKKPQRELADAAGVSVGQVNNALEMFRESGFGPGGYRSDSELLDLWVASFPSGLGKKLVLATYRGSIEDFRKVDAEDPVFVGGAALSGELAVEDLLRPAALTIYVTELDPMLPVKNRWRSDGEANITVRRKFWRTPPHETHDYDGPLTGLRNAPAVLVYADLMASDDARVRSVAPERRKTLAEHGQDH